MAPQRNPHLMEEVAHGDGREGSEWRCAAVDRDEEWGTSTWNALLVVVVRSNASAAAAANISFIADEETIGNMTRPSFFRWRLESSAIPLFLCFISVRSCPLPSAQSIALGGLLSCPLASRSL